MPCCQSCLREIKPGEAFAVVKYRMAYPDTLKVAGPPPKTLAIVRDRILKRIASIGRPAKRVPDDAFHLSCGIIQRYEDDEFNR